MGQIARETAKEQSKKFRLKYALPLSFHTKGVKGRAVKPLNYENMSKRKNKKKEKFVKPRIDPPAICQDCGEKVGFSLQEMLKHKCDVQK